MTPVPKSKVVRLKNPEPSTKFSPQECQKHGNAEGVALLENVLKVIGGKWKVLIVYHLSMADVVRFGELKRKIPGITQRVLTNQLREMETDGLIDRKVYPEVPPKVEYSLSEVGLELKPVYQEMWKWGGKNEKLLAKIAKSRELEQKTAQA